MKEIPAEHLDVLTEFREICMRNLPGFKESMVYGTPSYLYKEEVEVSWQSQKNQVILTVKNEEVMKSFKPQLKSLESGKTQIYFKQLDKIDLALITSLIQQVAKVKNAILV